MTNPQVQRLQSPSYPHPHPSHHLLFPQWCPSTLLLPLHPLNNPSLCPKSPFPQSSSSPSLPLGPGLYLHPPRLMDPPLSPAYRRSSPPSPLGSVFAWIVGPLVLSVHPCPTAAVLRVANIDLPLHFHLLLIHLPIAPSPPQFPLNNIHPLPSPVSACSTAGYMVEGDLTTKLQRTPSPQSAILNPSSSSGAMVVWVPTSLTPILPWALLGGSCKTVQMLPLMVTMRMMLVAWLGSKNAGQSVRRLS